MRLLPGLAFSVVSGGLVACSLNAVDPGNRVLIRLEGWSSGKGGERAAAITPLTSSTPPPSAVTGFDCIGVNVTGPGIEDSSHNPEPNIPLLFDRLLRRESYCSYRGLLVGPISTTAATPQEISLVVPPGAPRLIQVVGLIERNGSTDCVREFQNLASVPNPSGSPKVEADAYELGRAVVDLFQDRVVAITPDWDGLSAADQIAHELKCSN